MSETSIFDCAVVGSGPAGLSAALNLHQRGKSVRILGTAPSLLEKAERIDNYLGLPGQTGTQMMDTFRTHAAGLGLVAEGGKVLNILPMGGSFMLNLNGDILEARCVILCGGVYRAKALPGEAELLGRGVSYCATCDGMLYRGKQVVVWGNGADAVEEADFLAGLGCQVLFVAGKEPEGTHGFTFRKGRLAAIEGSETVTGVIIDGQSVPCQGVFLLRDAVSPAQLVPGLEVDGAHIVVDRAMNTNLPGLFAAGDCTGAPYQIAKAVGEGQVAALSAAAWLDKQTQKETV